MSQRKIIRNKLLGALLTHTLREEGDTIAMPLIMKHVGWNAVTQLKKSMHQYFPWTFFSVKGVMHCTLTDDPPQLPYVSLTHLRWSDIEEYYGAGMTTVDRDQASTKFMKRAHALYMTSKNAPPWKKVERPYTRVTCRYHDVDERIAGHVSGIEALGIVERRHKVKLPSMYDGGQVTIRYGVEHAEQAPDDIIPEDVG